MLGVPTAGGCTVLARSPRSPRTLATLPKDEGLGRQAGHGRREAQLRGARSRPPPAPPPATAAPAAAQRAVPCPCARSTFVTPSVSSRDRVCRAPRSLCGRRWRAGLSLGGVRRGGPGNRAHPTPPRAASRGARAQTRRAAHSPRGRSRSSEAGPVLRTWGRGGGGGLLQKTGHRGKLVRGRGAVTCPGRACAQRGRAPPTAPGRLGAPRRPGGHHGHTPAALSLWSRPVRGGRICGSKGIGLGVPLPATASKGHSSREQPGTAARFPATSPEAGQASQPPFPVFRRLDGGPGRCVTDPRLAPFLLVPGAERKQLPSLGLCRSKSKWSTPGNFTALARLGENGARARVEDAPNDTPEAAAARHNPVQSLRGNCPA